MRKSELFQCFQTFLRFLKKSQNGWDRMIIASLYSKPVNKSIASTHGQKNNGYSDFTEYPLSRLPTPSDRCHNRNSFNYFLMSTRGSRVVYGKAEDLSNLKRYSKLLKYNFKVFIVQPGIDTSNIIDEMRAVLSCTENYLDEVACIPLVVIGS